MSPVSDNFTSGSTLSGMAEDVSELSLKRSTRPLQYELYVLIRREVTGSLVSEIASSDCGKCWPDFKMHWGLSAKLLHAF